MPTFNRNDLLVKCLNLLAPDFQSLDRNRYEVIITDDSTNFSSNALAEKFNWAKFVGGPKRGPAANRNNGAKDTKGDWLIFIDDDCLPSKDLLLSYYEEILKGKYNAIEGMIDAERAQERFDEEAPLNLNGGCFWSCNIAVKKKVFLSLNGFDEGFPYPAMEDVDFYERLKKVGMLTFLPSAKVIHPWRISKPFKNFKMRLISNRYMLNKHSVQRGLSYRFKRLKLLIGLLVSDLIRLKKFSFKGIGTYIEQVCFQFCMLFV